MSEPPPVSAERQRLPAECGLPDCSRFQVNCDFTSGLDKTTSAQMPMGKPTRQQGETQGTTARMLAVIAQP